MFDQVTELQGGGGVERENSASGLGRRTGVRPVEQSYP